MSNVGDYLRVPKLAADNASRSVVRNPQRTLQPVPPLVPLKPSLTSILSQTTSRKSKVNNTRNFDRNETNSMTARSASLTSLPDCVSDRSINQYSKNSLAAHDSSRILQSLSFKSKQDFNENPSGDKSDFPSRNCLRTINSHKQTSYSSSSLNNDDGKEEESSSGTRYNMSRFGSASDRNSSNAVGNETRNTSSRLQLSSADKRMPLDKAGSVEGSSETEDEPNRTDARVQRKKRKKRNSLTADCSNTRYDVVRESACNVGFAVSETEDKSSFLVWYDCAVPNERISELQSYQRINHFPGMAEICRKDNLARNMARVFCKRMARAFPEVYNFAPKTWILPSEYAVFQSYVNDLKKKKKSKTFIVKPPNGAMGNGIMLCRNTDKIQLQAPIIVQEYIDKPFLVDGFKCDMRIYVLLTSCDPLHIFLFPDGLLRMGTEKYVYPTDSNLDRLFMHLTNYSINKHSDSYEKGEAGSTGSKRTLTFLREYLQRTENSWTSLWRDITDLIIKTLIMAHPHVYHAYRMCRPGQSPGADSVCFEVLGFDIIVDRKMRPWLLEINRAPSFGTDEEVDQQIKSAVLEDAFRLLNIRSKNKRRNMAEQKAEAQRRLLRPTVKKGEKSEGEKRRQSIERRKEELTSLLYRLKKEEDREEFERKHCGRYQRIFPPEDRFTKEKYNTLLLEAHRIFRTGSQGQGLHQEFLKFVNNNLKDFEIEELLAQAETDEQQSSNIVIDNSLLKKPKKTPVQDQERTELVLYSTRASRSRLHLK